MSDRTNQYTQGGPSLYLRRPAIAGLTAAELAALALSALWLIVVTIFWFATRDLRADLPPDPVRGIAVLLSALMPVGLIWVAAMVVSSARMMKEETRRLQAALDAMRQAYVAQQQAAGTSTLRSSVERKIDALVAAQKETDAKLATFTSSRATSAGPSAAAHQAQPEPLVADSKGERPPLDRRDFLFAINFPETADDREGFRALRRALAEPGASDLVHASQDILTLLSQEGIYMDDLSADHVPPSRWRKYADGVRGEDIGELGAVGDRAALALAAARMRQDGVFRDAAYHFLRRFDQIVSAFVKDATETELAALSETRTARAFMLLGRVAGLFG